MSECGAASVDADRVLAERVWRDRDEEAFRALYHRHTPALYQFALRLLGGNTFDAEDVVQQAWINATDGLSTFRWESGLSTWLHGIVLNLCRSLFRRADRRWIELRDDLAALAPRQTHDRLDLEAALATLPPGYRTVVILHDVEGFTHEQIAACLEISANTSKSQLSRGRQALRSLLRPESVIQ